jgi:hypothetical protein
MTESSIAGHLGEDSARPTRPVARRKLQPATGVHYATATATSLRRCRVLALALAAVGVLRAYVHGTYSSGEPHVCFGGGWCGVVRSSLAYVAGAADSCQVSQAADTSTRWRWSVFRKLS